MEFRHQTVMPEETVSAMEPVDGGRYVDCTCGGGGHTRALLERVAPTGTVLALDRDPDAIAHVQEVLAAGWSNLILRKSNFSEVGEVMADLNWESVDGMIMDLGVSSYQLEGSGRGFSFTEDEPLDMRMNPDEETSAADLIGRLPEKELADLIYQYGEERGSRRVARAIVKARQIEPIRTTRALAEIVRKALWRPGKRPRIDSATRTFQALRIAVNEELGHLADFLALVPDLIRPGGRLAVISFHSLEDRLVKRAMIGPKRKQEDVEGAPRFRALYKKPLRPSEEEVKNNPRSRSAKLRIGERI